MRSKPARKVPVKCTGWYKFINISDTRRAEGVAPYGIYGVVKRELRAVWIVRPVGSELHDAWIFRPVGRELRAARFVRAKFFKIRRIREIFGQR